MRLDANNPSSGTDEAGEQAHLATGSGSDVEHDIAASGQITV
jgi:hypothetical protein